MSHNPFSDTHNNGKTLSAFFEGWPTHSLAQLFFSPMEPSFRVCQRFLRVTDLDMLRAALGRPMTAGVVAGASSSQASENARDGVVHRAVRRVVKARWPVALMIRSAFWTPLRLARTGLHAWLDEFRPQVVFYQSSNCTFPFEIVEALCVRYDAALVMETTDDYVTPRPSVDPAQWVHHHQLSRHYRRAVERADAVVAIGEVMANEYRSRFGGTFVAAMNSVEAHGVRPETLDQEPLILHYAGNLGLNRWRVLARIGQALRDIAKSTGIAARLEIYSLDCPSARQLKHLSIAGHCRFAGRADSQQLSTLRADANVLVHVESSDRQNRRITRLSVSTKIPEYLAADRCILAVGPADVASIRHLADNRAAEVVSSDSSGELKAALLRLLRNPHVRRDYARRGLDLVQEVHNRHTTQAMIRDLLVQAARRPQ